jgi:hypothetical protein
LLMIMTGGQRRQVIADLQATSIQWTSNDQMFALIGAEKVLRSRTNKIPLPNMLKTFVEFFKQKIRPYICFLLLLLHSQYTYHLYIGSFCNNLEIPSWS